MPANKAKKAWIVRIYKPVKDSNAGIFWYKVVTENGKYLFESAYEDECLRFCEDPENNLQLEEREGQ